MLKRIPFNAEGITVFTLSMVANAFSLWILLWILWGKIQIHPQARLLMLIVNFSGVLWNTISVIRYYYQSPPYSELFHYLLGMIVFLGDFMAQFEILKLFHVISRLDPSKIQRFQWISLAFCCVAGVGPVFRLLDPLNFFLDTWDTYGAIIVTVCIFLFYLWYQIFLVTKLYQSMQQSTKKHDIKSQNTIAYVQFTCKLLFLGIYQLLGVIVWGWGYMGSMNREKDMILIRTGECIAQSHLVWNVLFIKAIKEFTFPTRTPTVVRKKGEEDTVKL
jgi:hypothetical protein